MPWRPTVVQARRMLEKRLPIPAYDMLLKCSHAFNVMDARGAVGVTERADCFATMRALAREVTGEDCSVLIEHDIASLTLMLPALLQSSSKPCRELYGSRKLRLEQR